MVSLTSPQHSTVCKRSERNTVMLRAIESSAARSAASFSVSVVESCGGSSLVFYDADENCMLLSSGSQSGNQKSRGLQGGPWPPACALSLSHARTHACAHSGHMPMPVCLSAHICPYMYPHAPPALRSPAFVVCRYERRCRKNVTSTSSVVF